MKQADDKPLAASLPALDPGVTLALLRTLADNETTSQRTLARRLGVAVGLVNAYVKRCVGKGWLKMSQVNPSCVAYMLTPKGFVEKARLTSEYLSQSLGLFREARQEYDALFQQCQRRQWRRVVFYGCSEMSDIAFLCARDAGIVPVAVVDSNPDRGDYLGIPRVQSPQAIEDVDAVIVTAMWNLPEIFEILHHHYDGSRILAPSMLQHLRRRIDDDTPDGRRQP